jgi:hypothetical protein
MDIRRQVIFLLLLGSVLQFMFRQTLFALLPLPMHAPFLSYLAVIGTFGLFLYLTSFLIYAFLSFRSERLLLPVGVILLFSTVVPVFWDGYNTTIVWFWLVIFSVILSSALIVSSLRILRNVYLLSLLPIFALSLYSYYPYVLLTLHVGGLSFPTALLFLLASVSFFTVVLSQKKIGKRGLISDVLGFAVVLSFLTFILELIRNRFLQMIMDMVIPSTLGIVFVSPSDLLITLVSLSLSVAGIVMALGKGLQELATGYLVIMTTSFLGYTGFHLMVYLFSPALGAFLLSQGFKTPITVQQANRADSR